MTGFVSFVSAGPGDPELLTVRAVNRIGTADAILFDDLSSGPILALARADADLVGVGKRAGRASPKQDHVSRLLVDYAMTGARVVRLKSGDSGIFGRLEEELDALRVCLHPQGQHQRAQGQGSGRMTDHQTGWHQPCQCG
jgi:uroporphyrin-III C-methyltransferase